MKLTSGDEVIGILLDQGNNLIYLKNPLKIQKEKIPEGEYVSFASFIPFQLNEYLCFETSSIVTHTELTSDAMILMYNKNVDLIKTKNDQYEKYVINQYKTISNESSEEEFDIEDSGEILNQGPQKYLH